MGVNLGKTYVVGISGASGGLYGVRLVKALAETSAQVMVILTHAGKAVLAHEMGMGEDEAFIEFLARYGVEKSKLSLIKVFCQDEFASAPASGSFIHHGMAVVPCSMKSLGAIAAGYGDNLMTRSCDVTLKEKRPLILVPRETPFNLIHLENMTRVARAGGVILPPSPSFYTFPQTLEALADTVVSRILDHLGAGHNIGQRWGSDC